MNVQQSEVRNPRPTNNVSNPTAAMAATALAITTTANTTSSSGAFGCCPTANGESSSIDDSIELNDSQEGGNNNTLYHNGLLEKQDYHFPKRPPVDIVFRDIRYDVRRFNIAKAKFGKYVWGEDRTRTGWDFMCVGLRGIKKTVSRNGLTSTLGGFGIDLWSMVKYSVDTSRTVRCCMWTGGSLDACPVSKTCINLVNRAAKSLVEWIKFPQHWCALNEFASS